MSSKLASPITFAVSAFIDVNTRKILVVSRAWSLTFDEIFLGDKFKTEITSKLYRQIDAEFGSHF